MICLARRSWAQLESHQSSQWFIPGGDALVEAVPVRSRGLDQVTLKGLFQPKPSCDPMIYYSMIFLIMWFYVSVIFMTLFLWLASTAWYFCRCFLSSFSISFLRLIPAVFEAQMLIFRIIFQPLLIAGSCFQAAAGSHPFLGALLDSPVKKLCFLELMAS